ncbi:MAG TPA: sugar phosphate isomerase/epimerase family protein [Planctomycetota bacterium]|nr:sugar phosphate isomerase/epimerase family protein [Planctomycetota bacterium]
MNMARRGFVMTVAGGLAAPLAGKALAAEKEEPRIRLSACDWSLRAGGPGGLDVAKACGLDGLEVAVGGAADKLNLAKPEVQQQYKDKMKETGVVISSTAMTLGNSNPLATEANAVSWMTQTVEATKALGARPILLAFFGKGDLRRGKDLKTDEVDNLVARLKEAAPKAKEAGVVLGLENTLSAKQNLAIIERVGSDAVAVYYDCFNSQGNGYDVCAEIRDLKGRVCCFHFKNGGDYLETGRVKWEPIRDAMNDIGYKRWIVLETSCPSKDRDADFKKNAAYVRKLFSL